MPLQGLGVKFLWFFFVRYLSEFLNKSFWPFFFVLVTGNQCPSCNTGVTTQEYNQGGIEPTQVKF